MSRSIYFNRLLDLKELLEKKSCFLFGPRQTGKTTYIQHVLTPDYSYNLLESDTFLRLTQSPQRLREEIIKTGSLVVIDEIQKIPSLLNEVHLIIEQKRAHFLLTGSSARKLRHKGVNLLGGRARHRVLHPLIYMELKDQFNLMRALNNGLIPSIYGSDSPQEDLASYIGDYLQEEIAHEGLVRSLSAFSRFLEIAALSSGQLINYTNIGNDAQVPRTSVHEYFQILKDTLLAHEVEPWRKSKKRKPLSTSKFYLFDIGVIQKLKNFRILSQKTIDFGVAFENYMFHELQSFCDYTQKAQLTYWRSQSDFEVDFILNDDVAIEVKAKKNISNDDLSGLKALSEEHIISKFYVVSLEERPRKVNNILILPWAFFLESLWGGDIL